ncbi:deoxyhypusine synthase family protein [Candidatus Woesearchaeota archaeon]|nr:deoxyhypusine synthase family protein [Candidatus Woesearchaeota archaeon]
MDSNDLPHVKQIELKKAMSVDELLREMGASGVFGAGKLAKAADIFTAMVKDAECVTFLGVAGALVPGGMRNILIDIVNLGYADVVVTTGAILTHDMVEALGHRHYQGSEHANDQELFDAGFDRMYDSYMPNKAYGDIEHFFSSHYAELKDITTIRALLLKIGQLLPGKSLLGACAQNNIPLFSPALADSGIGLMMYNLIAAHKPIAAKAFDDLPEMINLAWGKKCGVVYLGGGVPKNFIQQAMQFAGGASYGIQITTDRPEAGGSSGAELKEGISWGKLHNDAMHVTVPCDVTIALPLIVAAAKSRL